MFKHVATLALSVSLAIPAFAQRQQDPTEIPTQEREWFFTAEKAAKLRAEMKTNPVDSAKVQANLEKIAALVRRSHADKINDLKLSVEDQKGLIAKAFAVNLMAKSPFFDQLLLKVYAKEDLGALLFYNVDTVGLEASVTVDSYSTLKALLLEHIRASGKTPEQATTEAIAKCGTVDLKKTADALRQINCIVELSLLTTESFSEFLVKVDGLVKALKTAAQAEIRKNVSYFDFFTGVKAYTCNKNSWFCRGEYLYASVSGNAGGVGRVDFSFQVDKSKLQVALSISAKRQIAEFLQGTISEQITGIDLVKFAVLKEIQNLTDSEIEGWATSINEIIDGAMKLATKKNQNIEMKQP